MLETEKLKRPAAHRWVIGLLWFMTSGFVIILLGVLTGRSGENLGKYWLSVLFLCGCAFALFCMVVGGRHRLAYYVTSGLLGIWAIRGVYTVLIYAWRFAFGKDPVSTSPGWQVLMVPVVGLIVWIFLRFTFSRESRSYFQLKSSRANDAG